MLYRHLEVVISFYLIFKIKAVFNHNCAQSFIKMTHSDAKKTSFENSDKASNGNPGFLNLPCEILWNSIFSLNDTEPVFSLKIVPYNTFTTSSWFKPLFLLSIYIPPNICRTSHKKKGRRACPIQFNFPFNIPSLRTINALTDKLASLWFHSPLADCKGNGKVLQYTGWQSHCTFCSHSKTD